MRRVVVVGLDGLDPGITESMMSTGALPNLARLRETGGYRRLATTQPAQTPVAWSSFATGTNPGGHGIFDFLTRDPATYRPEVALHGFERRGGFLPPRPVNRRRGSAIWDALTEAGIGSVVLRHPCTFPPDQRLRGRMLAGVGVPDLRGGFGTSTVYTSSELTELEGERVVRIHPDGNGVVETGLVGPRGRGDADLSFDLRLRFDARRRRVGVESKGDPSELELAEGEWSDWLRVKFRAGALQSIRGVVRFHLVSAREPYLLYASPVNFDPEVPFHPISHPWDYAWEVEREQGTYHTQGMAEDHTGLNNDRITEAAFLAQCEGVRRERLSMMHYELARHDRGLFYCLFDTPDRVQHMFWRYRDETHPANRRYRLDPSMAETIESEYRACDDAVGQALEYVDADTLVLVASDHGFTNFRREVHLNGWLHRNGFLTLEPDAAAGDGADGLAGVDWSRTQAYALGLGGIYLNLAGREAKGIVAEEHAARVAGAIRDGLLALRDPEGGGKGMRTVRLRADVYHGPFAEGAPDLLIGTAPGYRISSDTALGRVPAELFSDNTNRWSGDHVVDPSAVPGILFSNRPIRSSAPQITDLAPTILHALGVPAGPSFEGEGVLE